MAGLPPNSNPHELLTCGICEEHYDDQYHQAKFLTCFHTFCSECLTKLSTKEQANSGHIQCPNCRSHTSVPESGVYGLQTNFYIASLREFSENTEPVRAAASFKCCHGQVMRNFFCVTCGVSICRDCTSADHRAKNGHFVISITETETSYIEDLIVGQMSLNTNKRNLQSVECEMILLSAVKETALRDIETLMKSIVEQLEQRKNYLTSLVLDQFNARHEALLGRQEQIETANMILNDNIAQAKHITKTADLEKLKPISESLREINEKTKTMRSDLNLGENHLAFDSTKGLDEFKHSLCTLGQVYTNGFLPSRISFRNTKAKAGHKVILPVEVYDHHGDKVPISSKSLTLRVTDASDTELQTLLSTTHSEHAAIFTPQTGGLHQVSGIFLGQQLISEQTHISVSSNNPVLKFGETGEGRGAFNGPWDIAIDKDNCIFVADANNKLIQKFTADGEFLSQFSVAILNKDHTVCDIALDLKEGLIFCTGILNFDHATFRVTSTLLVFNLEGELKHTLTLSDGRKAFSIALDGKDHVILSDLNKKCLFKVDKKGNFVTSMGHISCPGYIAIGDDDAIISPDEDNDCIFIFNSNGTVRHQFGSSGTGNGQLKQPRGVAADGEYIVVSELGNDRIHVFKNDGTFVSVIESTEDPLDGPCGLALTSDGYVYVADTNNDCIKKYKYRDMS